MLAAAAALGTSFDLEAIRETSGRSDEETVAALEELELRGLLSEDGEELRVRARLDAVRDLRRHRASLGGVAPPACH